MTLFGDPLTSDQWCHLRGHVSGKPSRDAENGIYHISRPVVFRLKASKQNLIGRMEGIRVFGWYVARKRDARKEVIIGVTRWNITTQFRIPKQMIPQQEHDSCKLFSSLTRHGTVPQVGIQWPHIYYGVWTLQMFSVSLEIVGHCCTFWHDNFTHSFVGGLCSLNNL